MLEMINKVSPAAEPIAKNLLSYYSVAAIGDQNSLLETVFNVENLRRAAYDLEEQRM